MSFFFASILATSESHFRCFGPIPRASFARHSLALLYKLFWISGLLGGRPHHKARNEGGRAACLPTCLRACSSGGSPFRVAQPSQRFSKENLPLRGVLKGLRGVLFEGSAGHCGALQGVRPPDFTMFVLVATLCLKCPCTTPKSPYRLKVDKGEGIADEAKTLKVLHDCGCDWPWTRKLLLKN